MTGAERPCDGSADLPRPGPVPAVPEGRTGSVPGADLASQVTGLHDRVRTDPAGVAELAAGIQARAEALGDRETVAAAMIWQGEAAVRLGQPATAVGFVNRSRDLGLVLPAELMVRGWWLLHLVHSGLGDHPTAMERVLDAVAAFDDTVSRRLRTWVTVAGADTLADLGARDECLAWFDRARELADDDESLQIVTANNRAYCALSVGDVADARAQAEILLVLARRGVWPGGSVLDTLASVRLLEGDAHAAVELARQAVAAPGSTADDTPELMLTLARSLQAAGDLDQAMTTLREITAVCDQEVPGRLRVRILAQQAEILAALGDYRAAFETHKTLHATEKEVLAEQRAARARTRQAMFETVTAREEAAHYREQARRDPLTGLWNRLFMRERLAGLLASFRPGQPLCVALLDLDHFKDVNDTYSHEVGDEVLRIVAQILRDLLEDAVGTGPGSFAARIGGEELLLVLCADRTAARSVAERCRVAIATRDWSGLTPGRGVTLSGGLAAAVPDDTQASLLSRADRCLYQAKSLGRNQIRDAEGG